MANIAAMNRFFNEVDEVISRLSDGQNDRRRMLEEFFVSVLTIMDGLQARDRATWPGISLVAREDLPAGVEEINDGFLHEMWTMR